MTTTHDHQTETFSRQLTEEDAPEHCPPWCDPEPHSAKCAEEIPAATNEEEL